MTIGGYLLLHRSSARARLGHVDRSISSQKTIDPLGDDRIIAAGMPSQCSTESCQVGKVALYTAGVMAGGIAIGYFLGRSNALRKVRCNTKIGLTKDKVVDAVDVEDIGVKKVYCRCWKSNKFPLCDGSHVAHNKTTGDNVGPLIVESKKATVAETTENKL